MHVINALLRPPGIVLLFGVCVCEHVKIACITNSVAWSGSDTSPIRCLKLSWRQIDLQYDEVKITWRLNRIIYKQLKTATEKETSYLILGPLCLHGILHNCEVSRS